jgi:hypothetical protein
LTEVDSNSRLVYIMQTFVQNLSQTWRMPDWSRCTYIPSYYTS